MPFLLYVLAAAVFAQGTSEFMLSGLLPGIAADLAVPLASGGLLTSAFAAGIVVGAPAAAAAVRAWPPRRALVGFLAAFVLAHVAGALAPSFGVLLASRVVAALANAGFLAVALAVVARLAPPGREARALAVVLGGTTLALVAGVPLGAAVGAELGWRATLWCVATLSAACLVPVAALAPGRAVANADFAAEETANPALARSGLRAELALLRRPALRRVLLLAVLVNGATFCTYTFLAPVVTDAAGLGTGAVAPVLAAFGAGAFAGVILAGRLGDAHWRRILPAGGAALLTGWLALLLLAGSGPAVVALAAVQGLLGFGVGSVLIARIMAEARAAAMMAGAFATVALNVGAIVGPAAGSLALATLGPRGPVAVSAVLVLLALARISKTTGTPRRRLPT